ncbi:MAG: AhpC/TSA family protein [Duncaniella sp.]|nr:AhpC/TSA family protein [Duncaniella sp.]
MMSKLSVMLSGIVLTLSACAMETAPNYTITAMLGNQYDNNMAYLFDCDTDEKVDSVIVSDGIAKFEGHVGTPRMTRVIIGETRGSVVVMEQGEINISADGLPSGTPLNDKYVAVVKRLSEIVDESRSLNRNDSVQEARYRELLTEYDALPSKAYEENKDNVVGRYMYVLSAIDKPLSLITADMSANPMLASSAALKSICNNKRIQIETGEGKRYKDFSVEYDGKTETFSSYIKPGHYTLVDFWASWCGPCVRQLKVIKELYAKYKDKGLDVVGVAVWDKPEDTFEAIKKHDLQWPCIVNAQTIPTDLYGIEGIPCILLINPDGIIVSRGKQGSNLVNDVDEAMAAFEAAKSEAAQINPAITAQPADTVAAF